MASKPRFNLPVFPQHVIAALGHPWLCGTGASCPAQRANNRELCFSGNGDSHRYLDDLREAAPADL